MLFYTLSLFVLSCNYTLCWWIIVIFKTLFWVHMFWYCIFYFPITSSISLSLSLSLSLSFGLVFVWVNTWLFWKWEFEFLSKHNFGYANYRSVFNPFWFTSFIQSTLVHFNSIRSIQSTWVNSIQFGLLRSFFVYFGLFLLIRSI